MKDAYVRAGYSGNDVSRYELRRSADIDLRVNWLLQERIRSDTAARHRREKPIADLRVRLIKRLEKLAFSDARAVVQWDRKPIVDAEGNVTGFEDVVTPTPSHLLPGAAAVTVKGVSKRPSGVKVELHDPLVAIDKLCKIAGLFQDAPPVQPVTVNQLNIGAENSLEIARRLLFALAEADRLTKAQERLTIEVEKTGNDLRRKRSTRNSVAATDSYHADSLDSYQIATAAASISTRNLGHPLETRHPGRFRPPGGQESERRIARSDLHPHFARFFRKFPAKIVRAK